MSTGIVPLDVLREGDGELQGQKDPTLQLFCQHEELASQYASPLFPLSFLCVTQRGRNNADMNRHQ